MQGLLQGKRVLITGAGRGIGLRLISMAEAEASKAASWLASSPCVVRDAAEAACCACRAADSTPAGRGNGCTPARRLSAAGANDPC